MFEEDAINIYTDGSMYSKPRRGGIGVRIIIPDTIIGKEQIKDYEYPGFKGATNNQMELLACIEGLQEVLKLSILNEVRKIMIFTDSMYVVNNYRKAMFEWCKNKWLTSSGMLVQNVELWKQYIKAVKKIKKKLKSNGSKAIQIIHIIERLISWQKILQKIRETRFYHWSMYDARLQMKKRKLAVLSGRDKESQLELYQVNI